MAQRRAARRPPGPRPPPSWVNQDQSRGERMMQSFARKEAQSQPGRSKARPCMLPGIDAIPSRSLRLLALHKVADCWPGLDGQEREMFGVWLPPALREALLFTLAERTIPLSRSDLKALVCGTGREEDGYQRTAAIAAASAVEAEESWEEQAQESSLAEAAPIKRLSLSSSFGTSISSADLSSILQGRGVPSPRRQPKRPATNIFLTELCLAPLENPSWTELLHIVPYLPQLTHLDISHWPSPLYMHNSVSHDTVTSNRGGKSLVDEAIESGARALRTLSTHLSSLGWLRLEGCAWISAFLPAPSTSLSPRNSWPEPPNWSDDGGSAQEGGVSDSGPSQLKVDWKRSFTRLQTLRVSPESHPLVDSLLASEAEFRSFAAEHTLSPFREGGWGPTYQEFPPWEADALLRVPEPQGRPDQLYEGPQWVRRGLDGGTQAYTLQPALQVPAWRALTKWLTDHALLARTQAVVRKGRAKAAIGVPFAVERTGVDDAEIWVKDLVGRWETRVLREQGPA